MFVGVREGLCLGMCSGSENKNKDFEYVLWDLINEHLLGLNFVEKG